MTLTPPARSRAMHSLEIRRLNHDKVEVLEIITRGLKIDFMKRIIRKNGDLF